MVNRLFLYTVFHLNLCYSSIEDEQRAKVIKRCYWPLLLLANDYNVQIGIEASGFTLEKIAALDPAWMSELCKLNKKGVCEFIGSGYAQIIGPLVPAEVNAANLRIGNEIYEKLLGFHPQIALINEQAYSAGLIQHYLDAGYRAIIMEWDNPDRCHPEWNPEWRYLPQIACGQHGEEIAIIWNNSIAFQKFQRYAHGDMELDDYLDYLIRQTANKSRSFPFYGNDVEIFDFRPGRYHTEAALRDEGEWWRIRLLFKKLQSDDRFKFILPGQVLELINEPEAGHKLHLESSMQPIPVKKQDKYNITRWAVTGRDDLGINTACRQIYEALRYNCAATDNDWRELCYLWSSDFRTHITDSRWHRYCERLNQFQKKMILPANPKTNERRWISTAGLPNVKRSGKYLIVETESVRVNLNLSRGLVIDGLWLGAIEGPPLCGSLPHGHYDDITLGADWYTGHTVLETYGQPKVTDLSPVEPMVKIHEESGDVLIEGAVSTNLGLITKSIEVCSREPTLKLGYRLELEAVQIGSFRLGNITLNPDAFDRSSLIYRTCNGGKEPENFPLAGTSVEHGRTVSFLVSASCGIGITCGWIELGDNQRVLRIDVDKTAAALIGLISYREVGDTYFCRLALSAGEMDETRRLETAKSKVIECRISLTLA